MRTNPKEQKHLLHVDGLRALAIIPVLAFHAGVRGFSGGYVGVDVFFVISGFLITGIILSEKDRGDFSLSRFYVRRSKRILPALFAVLIASYVAAWVLLLPDEMREFGKSLASVAAFGSNILFWKTVRYFGPGPETLPLLHTWSLSVEEQFYIAFPILLLVAGAAGRRFRTPILIAAFALSLALSVWATPISPAASFYLLPTRAWELLAGTMALFVASKGGTPPRWVREAITLCAFLLIVGPVVFYTPQTLFPGAAAILPCLGAAGLIVFGAGSSMVGSVLRHRLPVAIGLISYSLYLWHWPILAFARVYSTAGLSVPVRLMCLAATLVLAIGSYFLIERPTRRATASARVVLTLAIVSSIAVCAIGVITMRANGFPGRFPKFEVRNRHLETLFASGRCTLVNGQSFANWDAKFCTTNPAAPHRVVLWGDSFAGHLAPGLRRIAQARGWQLVHYAKDYCPPLLGETPVQDKTCRSFNDGILKLTDARTLVIMSGRWSSYDGEGVLDVGRIEQTVEQLRGRGVRVILVGASPSFGFNALDDYRYRTGKRDAPVTFDGMLNRRLQQGVPSALFFNPMPAICPTYRCDLIDKAGERYVDNGHLSAHGSDIVATALSRSLPF
ncbi:acyltransferase family protein [Sphingomonas sp. CARO-RG-8B-R24-01]|uniref:acyltransferase family protein n=1 Tax=Sphingomonas sp. CARO-RG-8B-R24-01 TaxID=2914831 RepID=UPI001F59C74A|nr:acyltransferase family protein [Sphingomonas sp. CARO-RG-8B-R24-01]